MGIIKKILGIKEKPFVYARVDPESPYSGLDYFNIGHTYKWAIRIDGISIQDASRELCGKVINWDMITPSQMEDLKNKKLKMSLDGLKRIFR